ncbi:ATP-binding protein [Goodfellowiella coeruleoviolacea]|uniref:Histidine kinase n=1 Tax=Goodfellowiella coeruleoviolacea TaxID=334858 RepID=A0AAE3KHW7_9PSEU|nr:ATP-binding protein [Goodfellowiella coeruleoviolacea]MCP2166849.1 hypothetical protein [Goodfellowiella coeruleoviolacea]
MNAQTAQVDDLQLVALPSAVNCADLFVRFALTEWALRPMRDEAAQAARQLVTSTVENADPQAPGMITVRTLLRGDRLVIEVEDNVPAADAPSLAGLRTGVAPLPDGGRVVWCELPLPDGVTASAVPLPRRERRRSLAAEQLEGEKAEVDPEVIQRILYGLSRAEED